MTFAVEAHPALTPAQCAEVEALQRAVFEADGLHNAVWLSNEINFDRSAPCFFLGRADGALVSFLSLFLPERQAGEVTGFTAPQSRGRGHFTALLNEAAAVLGGLGVPDFLFALEPQGAPAAAGLRAHFPAAAHSHTEWRMRRTPDFAPLPEGCTAVPVTRETLADFAAVSAEVYGEDRRTAEAALTSALRRAYLVRADGAPAGIFSLAAGEALTLCGVAVPEKLRGRAYGNAVVRAALNLAFEAGKALELDVDSANPPALGLYRKFGFTPVFEVQYWRHPVKRI